MKKQITTEKLRQPNGHFSQAVVVESPGSWCSSQG